MVITKNKSIHPADIKYTLVGHNSHDKKCDCVETCLAELKARDIRFPRNMISGEIRTLIRIDDLEIKLSRSGDAYQFFHRTISGGCGTTFPSAIFTVEES